MTPGKLTAIGFIALIHQWRDMWNNQVLEHLNKMQIVAGTGIRVQHGANGTIISATGRSGAAAPSAPSSGLVIGVIKSATVGGGPATIAEITLNADGSYTESTAVHNVIIPRY